AENSRAVRVCDPLLELERKRVENLPWQPDGGEPVGAERDVQRQRRLDLLPAGRDGPRAGGCDRRPETPQPEPRPSRVVKLQEEVGSGRQVPVAARDEALDLGQDVVGETWRLLRHLAHNCCSAPMCSAIAAQAFASARSLTIFSTVSSGYAL